MATQDTGPGQQGGLTRRGFLQTAAAATVAGCAFDAVWSAEAALAYEGKPAYDIYFTTCPYCSASCGQRVVVEKSTQKVVDIYGDFESPMNSGGLCSKGAGSHQLVTNPRRIGAWTGTHPVNPVFAADGTSNGVAYKRTGDDPWAPIDLQTAMNEIADGMIAARAHDAAGWAAGNSKSVAFFGSSHINNEPNYVYRKLIADFGTSNTEHQARICHSTTVGGLAPAFGRGAMSNNWSDLSNSTLYLIMGGNPAENHPASMAHMNRGRKGPGTFNDIAGNTYTTSKPAAKMIVVEPRKTRTALQADLYVRIRPGTDIAFINGLVNYITDATGTGTGLFKAAHANKRARFEAFHNADVNNKSFFDDAGVKFTAAARPKYSDAKLKVSGGDYLRTTQTIADTSAVNHTVSDFPAVGADIYETDTVFQKLRQHVAPYTLPVVADICGCTQAEIVQVAELVIENSRCASVVNDADGYASTVNEPKGAGYRAMTMCYAMGLTQHTVGAQNVKSFAVLQTLMGNMGRPGGGINAMRGIHNVQGSTDMGLLYANIPAYSANPSSGQTFGDYMNKLYGNLVDQPGSGGARDPYVYASNGLQQKGFYSMTKAFFGDGSYRGTWPTGHTETASAIPDSQANMDALYSLWPKSNGDNHILMLRKMITGAIKAALVWGQNPAVTEPNQVKVRQALYNLDQLVVVDMFETETAAVSRKPGSTTYLIPASSHIEEAGTATNSGRVLQWRYQAVKPAGNTKTDMELLLRFAYALEQRGGFQHIKNVWNNPAGLNLGWTDAYAKLFGGQYGWTPGEVFDSEAVARKVYKQICAPQGNGGTVWIYLEAWDTVTTTRGGGWPTTVTINGVTSNIDGIRAKARVNSDGDANGGGHQMYKNWGYSWLVNRRVLYGTGDTPWDQADTFQGPDLVARLFVSTNAGAIQYSTAYRTIHRLADVPKAPLVDTTPAIHVLPGRFPAHCEPYESPRPDLADTWGYNSSGTLGNCLITVGGATPRGTKDTYPLVLTTFRCVEHFQGGPITRNNPYNHEAEPEPWIEINSTDARNYGIKDGDRVRIVTARTEGLPNRQLEPYGAGFKARVGSGLQSNQRIGAGVVGIPFHWAEKGLSTGSRANDLTIDAMDANTTMPEYKACLCRLEKM